MPYSVYKIPNRVNKKLYIGVTVQSLHQRFICHKVEACGRGHTPLYQAMREFGIENFTIELLEECSDHATMLTREEYLIRTLNTLHPHGYNVKLHKLTDEQAAIVRFNVYGWTIKQYAQAFNVSTATIGFIRSKYHWNPYKHITRDHIPKIDVDAYQVKRSQADEP